MAKGFYTSFKDGIATKVFRRTLAQTQSHLNHFMSAVNNLLIVFLLFAIPVPAQRFLVSNRAENILYANVPNPLSVVVDGVSCNKLVLKAENAIIEQEERSSCGYTIIPENRGMAKVIVYRKKKNALKKVGEMAFRVRSLPLPEPVIGALYDNTCSKKNLIAMGGVRAVLTNSYGCADFSVERYKATLIRNNAIIAVVNNTGPRYTSELLACLNNTEINDSIIISDVIVRYPDNKSVALKQLSSYTITEQ